MSDPKQTNTNVPDADAAPPAQESSSSTPTPLQQQLRDEVAQPAVPSALKDPSKPKNRFAEQFATALAGGPVATPGPTATGNVVLPPEAADPDAVVDPSKVRTPGVHKIDTDEDDDEDAAAAAGGPETEVSSPAEVMLTTAQVEQMRAENQFSTEEQESLLHVDVNAEVVELNSLRIFDLTEIEALDQLKCSILEFRKNLIHNLRPMPENLRRNLTVFDLFDNKIRKIGPFFAKQDSPIYQMSKLARLPLEQQPQCHFFQLRKLDLSYNQIKTIEGLDDLAPTLEELYLVENRIKDLSGLEKLVNLTLLELGGNALREVGSGLENLVNLEQLWLGKNKIATVTGVGFSTLRKLKKLSLQANRFVEIPAGIFRPGANPELSELYLSENGLKRIENIEHLTALELVDYSMNPIATITLPDGPAAGHGDPDAAAPAAEAAAGAEQPVNVAGAIGTVCGKKTVLTAENFPQLLEFWLTDAKLDDWRELEILAGLKETLETVYLERTPLEHDRRYRSKVFDALPFLTQIDSWPVVNRQNPDEDRSIRR